ncbi:MAG: hypothetical protein RRY21_06395, partial [Oscillospiraceae bacterium]
SPLSAHVVRRMVEYDVLNLGGQPWDDAARREIRCESFVELFSEAAQLAADDIDAMVTARAAGRCACPNYVVTFDNGSQPKEDV